MEQRYLEVYLLELDTQCRYALIAGEDVISQIRSHSRDTDRIWLSLQASLSAMANISKLLWPGRAWEPQNAEDVRQRGKALRQLLHVAEDSPLAKRHLRDHFEHFDERLDRWRRSSPDGSIAMRNVFSDKALRGLDYKNWVGNLDPDTLNVRFFDDPPYSYMTLFHATEEMRNKLKPYIEHIWFPAIS